MGSYYLVIKKINGHRYYYHQRTWREGSKIKCHCIYRGPVDKVARPAARYTPGGFKTEVEELAHKINKAQTPIEVARLSAEYRERQEARLAYSQKGSMNGGMMPNKDSDLETGAQLYGCIPGIIKIEPALRETLHDVVKLGVKYPRYEMFVAHALHPKTGIFKSPGQILTFSRALTGHEQMNDEQLKEFFYMLHLNADELEAEYSKTLETESMGAFDLHENHTFSNKCQMCLDKFAEHKDKGPIDEPASAEGIDKAIAEKGFYELPECKTRNREMEEREERYRLQRLYNKLAHPTGEDEYQDAQQDLMGEHLAALTDKNADAFNLGWFTDVFSIASKTDKGVITTTIHPDGTITHSWNNGN